MNVEKIKEVFSDEAFVEALVAKETPEEVQAMLLEKDIEVSVEDIIEAKDYIVKKIEQDEENFELSEEELEDVSGGFMIFLGIMGVLTVATGVAGIGLYTHIGTRGRW